MGKVAAAFKRAVGGKMTRQPNQGGFAIMAVVNDLADLKGVGPKYDG
jgi:hypothetical protein